VYEFEVDLLKSAISQCVHVIGAGDFWDAVLRLAADAASFPKGMGSSGTPPQKFKTRLI
jgi:hypothetical protein